MNNHATLGQHGDKWIATVYSRNKKYQGVFPDEISAIQFIRDSFLDIVHLKSLELQALKDEGMKWDSLLQGKKHEMRTDNDG